jgi:hypothetical protein
MAPHRPKAAATVVLPTPPLPMQMIIWLSFQLCGVMIKPPSFGLTKEMNLFHE